MESLFRQRIGFNGDLKELSKTISKDFDLGNFKSCEIILVGYEDFNFSLETDKGKYFIKVFSNERTLDDCKRIVDINLRSIEAGVSVPKLYQSEQGYLYILEMIDTKLRLIVMDFINGKDFFISKQPVTKKDMASLAHEASLINEINVKPEGIYDSWAIPNFLLEFEKKKQFLEKEDFDLIEPIVQEFKELKIETLPHCFVHGDIIKTNVIKDESDKIWIVDFSVSNYYPRIQELAILACDLLFDKNDKEESERNLRIALEEYQKRIKLTEQEIDALPIYIKLAHIMHVLLATYEKKAKNNNSEENDYFIEIGKAGLRKMEQD
jgi:Ser/Thr protein kinase RdoA (MazF antagonist)